MNFPAYVPRHLEKALVRSLTQVPATAVLGPRQCGKSTLVKEIIQNRQDVVYLDLERPGDLRKLEDPEWFLNSQSDKLVCLDEVQRAPEIFPLLRSLIDDERRPGRFLLLGSASRDLIRQSSETLAGRIRFLHLAPFLHKETAGFLSIESLLSRGGFPESALATDDEAAFEWRLDFISTFLERDMLQFAGFTPTTMRRLWQMLAHTNGETINLSKMGASLGVTHPVVRSYIDLLEGAFLVRQVPPFEANVKKRLIKSPKVYLTDTGLITALLGLKNFEQAVGHPVFGTLWESLVLAEVSAVFPRLEVFFYRTSHGNEVDFVLSDGVKQVLVECKSSVAPSLTRGNYAAIEDLSPALTLIAAPVEEGYPMKSGIQVVNLKEMLEVLGEIWE